LALKLANAESAAAAAPYTVKFDEGSEAKLTLADCFRIEVVRPGELPAQRQVRVARTNVLLIRKAELGRAVAHGLRSVVEGENARRFSL